MPRDELHRQFVGGAEMALQSTHLNSAQDAFLVDIYGNGRSFCNAVPGFESGKNDPVGCRVAHSIMQLRYVFDLLVSMSRLVLEEGICLRCAGVGYAIKAF